MLLTLAQTTIDSKTAELSIEAAKHWLMMKGSQFAISLLVFALILFFGRFVIKGCLAALSTALKKTKHASELLQQFALNIAEKILWGLLLMIAFSQLGIDIAPMIAGLGVLGFVIGFAFQETLGNLAAGFMIMLNQPFQPGHFVEAGGFSGSVNDLNIMATILTTSDNKRVTIPNGKIWGAPIVNYSVNPTRRIDIVVGISYDAKLDEALSIIKTIVDGNECVLETPAALVEVVELADSSVNILIRVWCDTGNASKIRYQLNKTIKETLDEKNIGLPYPQMDIHLHKDA